ncbi:MAG TPA: hypothetical protein EYG46_08265 [Myxococcales bacterium]|nr:hypothetical protein [Myxococcales bacterium]
MGKKSQKKGGGDGFLLVVILVLAGGGGAWNYQRNLTLESEQRNARPFQSYSDADLEQLAGAYSEKTDMLDRKYKASLEIRAGVRDTGALMEERVEEFERVQKIGDKIRTATTRVADSEARLREIRDEQQWRRIGGQFNLHLRRLTSL